MKKVKPFNPFEKNKDWFSPSVIKKQIKNLLTSYNGWYDPFCESIQNAIDSLEQRTQKEKGSYQPSLWITINLEENYLIVTDNGIGLEKEEFEKFLLPNITLKPNGLRGHKGMGATYLAYGFNYIQICSKTPNFEVVAYMENAREWVASTDDNTPIPLINIDDLSGARDDFFNKIDQGFSICIQLDKSTFPKDLSWIQAKDAETWFRVLSIKTALGAIKPDSNMEINIKLIDENKKIDYFKNNGIEYLWLHKLPLEIKTAKLAYIEKKRNYLCSKNSDIKNLQLYPSNLKNLDVIYEIYETTDSLKNFISLTDEMEYFCSSHTPFIYCAYLYSERLWEDINESLHLRSGYKLFRSGIQLSADKMPQGELLPIDDKSVNADLTYILIHFDNCEADIGRKSFPKEFVDFAQNISKEIVNNFATFRLYLNTISGGRTNITTQELMVEQWKEKLKQYEISNPLQLRKNNGISVTSQPAREQDVVALFNQLIGVNIIRGIAIMSTDQKFIYDSLYKVKINNSPEYIYDSIDNPLGIKEKTLLANYKCFGLPYVLPPKVLEYKYTIDPLIEEIKRHEKNSKSIDLLVVWETGAKYKKSYYIVSLLDKDNIDQRPYHGVTHIMYSRLTNEEEMALIVLKELIDFLNDPELEQERQREKYDCE